MGREALCKAQINGVADEGKAHLECDAILFRGNQRLKVPLRAIRSAQAHDGSLELEFDGGTAKFELGAQAARWAEKIRSPKSLLDKLGIKSDSRIRVVGVTDEEFLADLRGIVPFDARSSAEFILFEAGKLSDLSRLQTLRKALLPNGAIWIIYPKGQKTITQADVMRESKAAGLVDIKTCSFSATHSALKVVIPLAHRERAGAQ